MPIQDIYAELLNRGQQCLDALVLDEQALAIFSQCHNYQSDFRKLSDAIAQRPEAQVFLLAQREYQFALYALSIGNYRHAFISLRLFFELSLAMVEFSAHELKLRRWLLRLDDITWSRITNEETGIYSDSFIRPFDAEFTPLRKQHGTLAAKVYRECSEFVHGNIHTHPEIDSPLAFDSTLLAVWAEKSDAMRRCVIFSFAARYLKCLTQETRNNLEAIMLEVLGEVPAVQAFYEAP